MKVNIIKYNHKHIVSDLKKEGLNCSPMFFLCDYFPMSGVFIYRLNGESKTYVMDILINKLNASVRDIGRELIFELKKHKYKYAMTAERKISENNIIDGVSLEELDSEECNDDLETDNEEELDKVSEIEKVSFEF